MLEMQTAALENKPLLVLQGRLDGAGSSISDATISPCPDLLNGPVLLDMENVDYLSSAGLRCLVVCWQNPQPKPDIGYG
jgi:anti-anti-sigma factor